jgi:hypothetical protein
MFWLFCATLLATRAVQATSQVVLRGRCVKAQFGQGHPVLCGIWSDIMRPQLKYLMLFWRLCRSERKQGHVEHAISPPDAETALTVQVGHGSHCAPEDGGEPRQRPR